MAITRFSRRPSGDIPAKMSPISARASATTLGVSRWSEAQAPLGAPIHMAEAAAMTAARRPIVFAEKVTRSLQKIRSGLWREAERAPPAVGIL